MYTEDAGLEIAVILCIASPFLRQIAIGNAGPSLTLESMGAKQHFRLENLLSPIAANAIWDQHFRFSRP